MAQSKRISVRDVYSMSPTQIKNMTDRELRQATQALMDAGNKRIRRMMKEDFTFQHPTVREYLDRLKTDPTAVPFSLKGKGSDRRVLRAEMTRMMNFLNPQTSKSGNTLKGWRRIEGEFIQAMGGDDLAKSNSIQEVLEALP